MSSLNVEFNSGYKVKVTGLKREYSQCSPSTYVISFRCHINDSAAVRSTEDQISMTCSYFVYINHGTYSIVLQVTSILRLIYNIYKSSVGSDSLRSQFIRPKFLRGTPEFISSSLCSYHHNPVQPISPTVPNIQHLWDPIMKHTHSDPKVESVST